jgi:hypothetical protein
MKVRDSLSYLVHQQPPVRIWRFGQVFRQVPLVTPRSDETRPVSVFRNEGEAQKWQYMRMLKANPAQ